MRHLLRILPFVPCLGLAACSGGSGGGAGNSAPNTTGAVLVVVDTATGSDAMVQFQVDAAVLEHADGSTTPNLLANPHLVTLADPTGEADGLVLRDAPSGDYTTLHLLLVPSSGAALQPNGAILAANSVVDLAVPITDGLQHTSLGTSWLVIGHNGAPPPVGSTATWVPQMSARADGSAIDLGGLDVAFVQSPQVTARSRVLDDSLVRIEFAAGCAFASDDGVQHAGRDDFLRSLGDDQLRVRAELRRDGRCIASEVHRSGRNDNPRLIGRVTALEPATTAFVMDVQAQNGRGGWTLLPTRETVRVDASQAQLRRPNGGTIAFADLQVGNLVKVQWTSRSTPTGELPLLVAREVEVTGSAMAMHPEWQGRVQSVDTVANTLVVVPRNNDPIFVQGVSVASVTLAVAATTTLERRARQGGGRTAITLDDIVPGSDRIWWRGSVTGPTTIDATWIRVREE
ncbi:MAG: hypothetical protein JNM25_14385 [Planctomycetes bacterium]|nr:hypothetical protein [Planctomycetota bacterium]